MCTRLLASITKLLVSLLSSTTHSLLMPAGGCFMFSSDFKLRDSCHSFSLAFLSHLSGPLTSCQQPILQIRLPLTISLTHGLLSYSPLWTESQQWLPASPLLLPLTPLSLSAARWLVCMPGSMLSMLAHVIPQFKTVDNFSGSDGSPGPQDDLRGLMGLAFLSSLSSSFTALLLFPLLQVSGFFSALCTRSCHSQAF